MKIATDAEFPWKVNPFGIYAVWRVGVIKSLALTCQLLRLSEFAARMN